MLKKVYWIMVVEPAIFYLSAKMQDVQKNPEKYYSSENENIRKNGEKVWITWTQ